MDIEKDAEIPLILGRPFMLTSKCMVDMGNGNLEMSVDDQKVTFNLFDVIKHPSDHKACFKMEKVEHEVAMVARAMVLLKDNEASPVVISNSLTDEEECWLVQVLKKHKAAIG